MENFGEGLDSVEGMGGEEMLREEAPVTGEGVARKEGPVDMAAAARVG